MEEKKDFSRIIEEVFTRDSRYKPDSYEFLMQSLAFTQKKLKRQGHISGRELLEGIREFAIDQYGPMAKTVLSHWGISKTRDFGNMVFNLIEEKVLSRTEEDSLDDFNDIYDFDSAFGNVLRNITI
ncbi:MAG: hypothetical protein JW788_00125 [Candidatus Omnitrophica bacterium]|nr:hypothetical protein [Candidatus Omnitrophota bacterium]